MDQADLLICAAWFHALLFDDTGEPILLSFAERHGIDIRVDTLETDLGLFLLSSYAPAELHVSDFLVEILMNAQVHADALSGAGQRLSAKDGTCGVLR